MEKAHIKQDIFLQMQNYSFNFEGEVFDMDIVPSSQNHWFYELYEDNASLYMLVPFEVGAKDVLKIYYPRKSYSLKIKQMQYDLLVQFLLFSALGVLFALLSAWYSLKPLRDSVLMLEEFIKDIIHDLNTPISSILISLRMIKKRDEEEG